MHETLQTNQIEVLWNVIKCHMTTTTLGNNINMRVVCVIVTCLSHDMLGQHNQIRYFSIWVEVAAGDLVQEKEKFYILSILLTVWKSAPIYFQKLDNQIYIYTAICMLAYLPIISADGWLIDIVLWWEGVSGPGFNSQSLPSIFTFIFEPY